MIIDFYKALIIYGSFVTCDRDVLHILSYQRLRYTFFMLKVFFAHLKCTAACMNTHPKRNLSLVKYALSFIHSYVVTK